MIDLHHHLIPGIDDGARDHGDARCALAGCVAQGVRTIVCTPHLRASGIRSALADGGWMARCDAAWESLRVLAAEEFPGVLLHRGVELMLDSPSCDLSDSRTRLAGTRFVLLEFPFLTVPPNVGPALGELKRAGWTPVIAHPERYGNAQGNAEDAAAWKRMGAYLQVNAGSLLGKYGPRAAALSWLLVGRGMADFMGSDHHGRGTFHLGAAMAALDRDGGGEQAELLVRVNPARLLAGEDPLPVAALLRKPSMLERFGSVFRR